MHPFFVTDVESSIKWKVNHPFTTRTTHKRNKTNSTIDAPETPANPQPNPK